MIELCSGYLSECGFTLKRVRHMTRTYSQMHCTNKCSEHSSVIWPVRPNGLVFLYELSGSGFEFICRISKDSLLLHLLSCKLLIFVKENPDRKKNKLCFRTCKNRLSVCDGWRASWLFHDGDPYHIETRPLISRTNQWTGFYTTEEFVMKEFMLC